MTDTPKKKTARERIISLADDLSRSNGGSPVTVVQNWHVPEDRWCVTIKRTDPGDIIETCKSPHAVIKFLENALRFL